MREDITNVVVMLIGHRVDPQDPDHNYGEQAYSLPFTKACRRFVEARRLLRHRVYTGAYSKTIAAYVMKHGTPMDRQDVTGADYIVACKPNGKLNE